MDIIDCGVFCVWGWCDFVNARYLDDLLAYNLWHVLYCSVLFVCVRCEAAGVM